jgi:hypothetical protein
MTVAINRRDGKFLINGNFEFAQRAPVSAVTISNTAAYETADRWMMARQGNWTSNPVWERYASDKPSTSNYSSRYASMSATDATASILVRQRIESVFALSLLNKKVSVTIKYKGLYFQQIQCKLDIPTVTDNHASVSNFYDNTKAITNDDASWRELTFENISIPAGVERGLAIDFIIKNPSTFASTFSFKIAEVQINIGERAQKFSTMGITAFDELMLCKKYYQKSYALNTSLATAETSPFSDVYSAGGGLEYTIPLIPIMRTNPTVVTYSPVTGTSGVGRDETGGLDRTLTPIPRSTAIRMTEGASGTASGRVSMHWTASAEI